MTDEWVKCERCGTLIADVTTIFRGSAYRQWWERLGAARLDFNGSPVGDALIVHSPERCTDARRLRGL